MSHFSAFVMAPAPLEASELEGYVDSVMGRYDENREVKAYKNHMGGDPPKELWEFDFLVEQAAKGQIPGFSAEQVQATAEDWAAFVEVNNRYRSGGREDEYSEMGVDEDGAFEWSSSNPEARWDYWLFGGRWGDWLEVHEDADEADVHRCSIIDDFDLNTRQYRYATVIGGARVRAIDFQSMIDQAVQKATEEWETYERLVERCGTPKPLQAIADEVGRDQGALARQRYWSQPAVETGRQEAIAAHHTRKSGARSFSAARFDQYLDTDDLVTWWQLAADQAVVPYALVDFDGQWRAPERAGCFGASLDQVESRTKFNAETAGLIRTLPEEVWLAVLDCHI